MQRKSVPLEADVPCLHPASAQQWYQQCGCEGLALQEGMRGEQVALQHWDCSRRQQGTMGMTTTTDGMSGCCMRT